MADPLDASRYVEPRISDYGRLGDVTASTQLLFGVAAADTGDLDFSGSHGGPGGGGGDGNGGDGHHGGNGDGGNGGNGGNGGDGNSALAAGPSGSPTPPPQGGVLGQSVQSPQGSGPGDMSGHAGAGHGGGGPVGVGGGVGGAHGAGGRGLPFTGYAVSAVAATGAGLLAVGAALRRAVRRSD